MAHYRIMEAGSVYPYSVRKIRINTDVSVFIGPNCPGISGTVTDFFGLSRIPDSFIIVPEMEERRTISPLIAQVLASLAVYGGIIRSATCPKRFCG